MSKCFIFTQNCINEQAISKPIFNYSLAMAYSLHGCRKSVVIVVFRRILTSYFIINCFIYVVDRYLLLASVNFQYPLRLARSQVCDYLTAIDKRYTNDREKLYRSNMVLQFRKGKALMHNILFKVPISAKYLKHV